MKEKIKTIKDTSRQTIWNKKWKWWQTLLVLGVGFFIARLMSSGTIDTIGEIVVAAVLWLGLVVFVIWQQRNR